MLIDRFGGLNDTDPAASIENFMAQDALNVESSLEGKALLKRGGFSRNATLTLTTAPVNGSFSYIDVNGNRQDIVCQDHYCAKSTNGGSFAVFLSTAGGNGCIPKRWSFVNSNGTLYGANDCRDAIMSYNGTTVLSPLTMPAGAVLELTKDRMVVVDVATNPNGVYYSKSGDLTNFTVGINSADPYVDSLGSSGDRASALKWALGRLFIWKPTSLTTCILGDQYTSKCFPVSNVIGCSEPLSIVEVPGAIYFRGSDRNYWKLDAEGLTLVSKRISNFVASQTAGTVQSNTQSGASDWPSGTQTPLLSWNTTTTPGSIFPSSITLVSASSVSYVTGTLINVSTEVNGYIRLSSVSFSDDFHDNDYTTGPTTWTVTSGAFDASGGDLRSASNGTDIARASVWISSGHWQFSYYYFESGGTANNTCSQSGGTACLEFKFGKQANGDFYSLRVSPAGGTGAHTYSLRKNVSSTDTMLAGTTGNLNGSSVIYFTIDRSTSGTITVSTGATANSSVFLSSTTDGSIPGNAGYLELRMEQDFVGGVNKTYFQHFDNFIAFAFNSTGRWTSPIFDTTYSSPTWGPFSSTITVNQNVEGQVIFYTRVSTSPNNDVWDAQTASSVSFRISSAQKRYAQVEMDMTTFISSKTPTFAGLSLPAATTGQFATQCITPNSNISSWGTLSCAETKAGAGSLTYYLSTGTACAYISTSAWTAQSNNGTVSIATAAAVAIRFDSLLGSSTDQAQVDACTLSWSNGIVSPPSWGAYDSLKNVIYWTTSINNNSTNNRVLKYDLNLDQWYPFDLAANAFRNIQGTNYFGGSTSGYWNQYGSANADNGAAISAYWKSKDFGGSSPFSDTTFNTVSLVTKNQSAGSLTVTYSLSNNTSGSYTVSLSTTSGAAYVHANASLPILSPQPFMNLKFSNNSSIPFEIDGFQIEYKTWPWKQQNP